MPVENVRTNEAIGLIRRAQAFGIEAAMEKHAEKYREAVDVKFPPASVEGEFPRKRTGRGQEAISVASTFTSSRTYLEESGIHLQILERGRNRKGLAASFLENKEAIIAAYKRVAGRNARVNTSAIEG